MQYPVRLVCSVMGWMQFVSEMTGHLVWPVLVLLVVLVLRTSIRSAIEQRIKSVTLPGGAGAEFFDKGVERVREELQATGPKDQTEEPVNAKRPTSNFLDEIDQLAEVSPDAAVMEAFRRLEKVIRSELEAANGARPTPLPTLVKQAVDEHRLPPSEASAFNELRVLRNALAHDPGRGVDRESAMAFAEVARQLAISLWLSVGKTIADGEPI